MKLTLKEWQQLVKPKGEILYNCSEFKYLNDEWVPFPIGMGYTIINYTDDLKKTQIGTHDNLVLCAIAPNTDERRRSKGKNRRSILSTLAKKNIHNTHFNSNQYFNNLPSYKFVISPEGNGIDCHRHYETLMAGCIPIMEDHPGIRIKYEGCPIIFTNDYSEITKEFLEAKYEEMLNKEFDFSKLLFSSYSTEIQNEIKANGNYWANRLTGRNWY